MNGFRMNGMRRVKLMEKIRNLVRKLDKKGINPKPYLQHRYQISEKHHWKKIRTKELTGVISDLSSLLNS